MKNTSLISVFLAALAAVISTGCPKPAPSSTCETFDGLPLAQYDTLPPTVSPPGSVIFSVAGGVPVSIHSVDLGSGPYFNFAGIEAAPTAFGSGHVVNTNNVCIEFGFSAGGKTVTEASIEFLDMGGTENLWVNGAAYAGELAAAPATLGGASVTVASTPLPGGKKGKVKVKGSATTPIKALRIGGQEFYLDNLCYQ